MGLLQATCYVAFSYTLLLSASANAQSDRQEHALAMIRATADSICQVPPLVQNGSETELSLDAKAKVNGIVSRVADLGIEGAAKYKSEHSSGVLQTDLALAIADGNGCKLEVLKLLAGKLLAAPQPDRQVAGVLALLPPATQTTNLTLAGGFGVGSSKEALESDPRVKFSSSNGKAYGFKTVTLTLGRGLSQAPIGFVAYYYISSNSVDAIILQRSENTVCTSPLETATKLVLDDLIRKFGSPSDGPVVSNARTFAQSYDSVDTEITKYMFSGGGFIAYLTIEDKLAYPRASGRGNELTCSIKIEFQPS